MVTPCLSVFSLTATFFEYHSSSLDNIKTCYNRRTHRNHNLSFFIRHSLEFLESAQKRRGKSGLEG